MNCYYHLENAAIGICSACGKGICYSCLNTEYSEAVCCNNAKCKQRIIDIRQVIDTNIALQGNIKENMLIPDKQKINREESFNIIMGILFLGLGLTFYPDFILLLLFVIMGLTYLGYSIASIIKRYRRNKNHPET